MATGYSRIPILNGNEIKGILMVKKLIGVELGKSIEDLGI